MKNGESQTFPKNNDRVTVIEAMLLISLCIAHQLSKLTGSLIYRQHNKSSKVKLVIIASLMQFNLLTCIRFIHRTNQDEYLEFTNGDGCWSYIGPRKGKPQEISLSTSGCVRVGIIQHEVMHALGFHHEHTRSDRDKYIDIIINNIEPGSYGNFKIRHSNNLGAPYDYGSIMHYGRYVFSKGHGFPTILPKPNRTVPIGQIRGLSELDIIKINRLYNCNPTFRLSLNHMQAYIFGQYTKWNLVKIYADYIEHAILIG
ncbi:hatching enzyme 1.2-like [Rhincodon typus]|uniref:hatching enzyme 1.2-like n=1 Tax=Rhincodon typus TaxID=259920 RepID=UPI002030C32D|nr:hatching enzyme 1.2-like [Rhincodon typus]